MHLRVDWGRSNEIEFLSDGGLLEFECGSHFDGLRAFLGMGKILGGGGDYLWLRRRGEEAGE